MFLRWKYQKYNLKIPKKAKFGPKPETLLFTKQFDGADFNYSVKFLKFQSINTRKKTLFSTKFIDFSSFCLKLCVLTNSRELISNNGNSFLKLVYKNTQNKHFCSQIWNWFYTIAMNHRILENPSVSTNKSIWKILNQKLFLLSVKTCIK